MRGQLQAWRKVMAAYRQVYDSRHLQADCQEPGSVLEPYTLGNRVWATFTLFTFSVKRNYRRAALRGRKCAKLPSAVGTYRLQLELAFVDADSRMRFLALPIMHADYGSRLFSFSVFTHF